MTSHFVQKRKYRPGLHVTKPHLANARKSTPKVASLSPRQAFSIENETLSKKRLHQTKEDQKPSEAFVEKLPEFIQPVADWKVFEVQDKSEKQDPVQDYYEEKKAPISQSGMVGFFSALGSLISFILMFSLGAVPYTWIIVLFFLSLALALIGLIMSIRGLKDGYDFKRRGKAFSFVGLFTSATLMIIDLAMLFIVFLLLLPYLIRI